MGGPGSGKGQARLYSSEREKHRRRRLRVVQFIAEQKAKPCMDCGNSYPPFVMHFDHRDPTQKIAKLSSCRRFAQAVREMAKCDVVCSNCHAIRTFNAKHYLIRHQVVAPAEPEQPRLFH